MKITLKNVFTFLKENQIILNIKNDILKVLENEKDELIVNFKSYLTNKSDTMNKAFADYILSKIELPLLAKPFKGLIKKTIIKNLDKLEKFIQEKI